MGTGRFMTYESPILKDRHTFRKWLKEQKGVVVVKFYADWCKPCQRISNVVFDIVVDSNITLVEVNYDKNRDICNAFRVKGIPALVSFVNGEMKDIVSGSHIPDIHAFFKKVGGNIYDENS